MLRRLWTYGFWALAIGCWLMAFTSCNTTKFVPQDKYLLNKVRVNCEDDPSVDVGSLRNYLRQKQNTEILGFWKMQLDVYNTAPTDTTTKTRKKLARNAMKMGEAPVIYDEDLTSVSMQQLRQQMNNLGYFNAEVDTQKVFKKRKVRLTYLVTARQPYKIRHYEVDIPVDEVRAVAQDRVRCKIKEGEQFSTETLDEEHTRITTVIRNRGYFYFEKSMLEFTADSALSSHEVDVRIHLAPFVEEMDSAQRARLHTQYFIRNV
ncbi:MAG: hypothetical protein J6Y39_05880, partial [Bacteroidaceae bacterium]|nr:hypothetical protein [Bacteroidaceae bacterium]